MDRSCSPTKQMEPFRQVAVQPLFRAELVAQGSSLLETRRKAWLNAA
jgi:hypothetical protein